VTPPTGEICRQHLDYMVWADDQHLTAVRAHMPHRLEILEHIFMAERIWLARIEGNVEARHLKPPAGGAALAAEWDDIHRKWQKFAETQADWGTVVSYKTLSGIESSSPLWQVALHLANHGSYHRGQVAAVLRAEGFTPPSTDLILWYRLTTPAQP
jgi:uncharacterized damage-inducible protein DinB